MKPECNVAKKEIDAIRDRAATVGIDIRTSEPRQQGCRPTLHVMFEHDGCRLLNWWPATGTAIVPGEKKTTLPDLNSALGVAIQLRNTLPDTSWI